MDKSIEKSTTKVAGSPSLGDNKRKAEDELETQTKRFKKAIASIKEDVASLQVKVASLQEIRNSLEAATFALPEDHKAKADTNTTTTKQESSSNVSSRESVKVEKKPPNRTLFPCSSVNRVEVASEIGKSREFDVVEKKQTREPKYSKNRLEATTLKIGRRVLFTATGQEKYGGTVFVKGYDPSLSEDDIMRALLKHFSPCGMVNVYTIYFHLAPRPLKGYAFVEMLHGLEEALKLNGSNMG